MKTLTLTVAGLASALACAAVQAQPAPQFDGSQYITGDWNGTRARLFDRGIDLRLNYTGEVAHNTSGGDSTETAYADQIYFGSTLDLERLWGWRGAEFNLEIVNRNGDLLNNEANMPTLLQVQEIHGRGSVTRLTQFSLTQHLFDERLSITGGRLYANGDFFGFSCRFQNLSFCGGLPGYITNGWFTDPISQYGLVVTARPNDAWAFKVGGYEVNTQNLAYDQGLRLSTRGDSEGTLMLAEIEHSPLFGDGLRGDYRLGGWRNSADYENLVDVDGLPTSLTDNAAPVEGSERGWYVRGSQQVWRNASGSTLELFANLVQASEDTNRVDQMITLGAWLEAPFAGRPDDRIGFAVGRTHISDRLTDAQRRFNASLPAGSTDAVDVQRVEYPMELNYHVALAPGLSIMPGVQYIRRANGVDGQRAVVFGMRLAMSL